MLPFACVDSCQRELYPRLRAGWKPSADFKNFPRSGNNPLGRVVAVSYMCPPDSSRITRYAEAILTSELGDWIVSQLPTTRPAKCSATRHSMYRERCPRSCDPWGQLHGPLRSHLCGHLRLWCAYRELSTRQLPSISLKIEVVPYGIRLGSITNSTPFAFNSCAVASTSSAHSVTFSWPPG